MRTDMTTDTADRAIADRIAALVNSPVTSMVAIDEGGYSSARRWLVTWAGGRAFAKLGTERHSAEGIRAEHHVYLDIKLDCMPDLIAYDDDEGGRSPLLLIEDLGTAHWAPPWSGVSIDDLLAALDEVQAARVPAFLQRQDADLGDCQEWVRIAENPTGLLAAQVCTQNWMVASLPVFAAAAHTFKTTGTSLLHGDLFPQNWCVAERGPVLVDWSGASVGNPDADRVHLLHGVRVSGGPWTDDIEQLVPANSVAWFAGRLAHWYTGRRCEAQIDRFEETQRRELWHGLCWAASVFDLAPPELPVSAAPIGDYRP
ncbi:MAG: aminoglycoside phosphotransferase family protein [Thermoleophilia bacterium]|nr:aminoglycoside phosphotransferase family protein [Thermoleophilia bacterium]